MSAIAETVAEFEVLTIGHSTHSAEEFAGLLKGAKVELLTDVRAYPSSRRVPHFNAPHLQADLAREGIAYIHARELGGRRSPTGAPDNAGWDNEQFRAYADHMQTDEFRAALDRLLAGAREGRTAVMCAEAPWWRCHRRLLSDALLVRGARVTHIGPDGSAEEHSLTGFAVIEGGRLSYPPAQGTLELG